MFKKYIPFFIAVCIINFLVGCSNSGTSIFKQKTAREKYQIKLEKEAPPKSAAWLAAGKFALQYPLQIPTPYTEYGVFAKDKPAAIAFTFSARQGQKIMVKLAEANNNNFTAYTELWERNADATYKLLISADTAVNQLSLPVAQAGEYMVSIQPELNQGGNFSLQIALAPGFGFPIATNEKSSIGSLWGDPRDGGVRKHEGIDIFAARGAKVVAIASGTINYIEETPIGGKIISLIPDNTNYSVYYAHLDTQLVSAGQKVTQGEVIGTVGNTGNAITTVPHLHFGIYTSNGAVDPLLFVKPTTGFAKLPTEKPLQRQHNITAKTKLYPAPAMQNAYAATGAATLTTEGYNGNFYRVLLDNGARAFVAAKDIK